MSDIIYNNTCLVCGAVMPLTEAETHLNQNVGHVLVETMVRTDDPVTQIAVNTRKANVTTEWDDQCQAIQAVVTDSDFERYSVDAKSEGWTSQVRRIKFRPKFPGIPTITYGDLDMQSVESFKIDTITSEYFEVTFQTKRTSGKIMPSLSFAWEAKINE